MIIPVKRLDQRDGRKVQLRVLFDRCLKECILWCKTNLLLGFLKHTFFTPAPFSSFVYLGTDRLLSIKVREL